MSASYCYRLAPPSLASTNWLDYSHLTQNISSSDNTTDILLSAKSDNGDQSFNYYRYLLYDFWAKEADPRTVEYPMLTSGPLSLMAIMGSYFLFVTVIGPKFMDKRKPFELFRPMLAYNILMVALNAYFFTKFISWCDYGREFLKTDFPAAGDRSERALAVIDITYYYFLTKFVDLLDTIFFVLRKKNAQVTPLHLYHHTVVPILGWVGMKISPMAPAYQLFGLLNSLVHVIMYSYYALSAFGPKMQPYLWWKRYITQIQLIQFTILIAYGALLAVFQTNYPRIWFWIVFIQAPIFFLMFFDFYLRAYRNRTKARKSA